MKKQEELFPVRAILRQFLGVHWTLENLDHPSPGWALCEREWKKHQLNSMNTYRMHRNLLRNESDTDMS